MILQTASLSRQEQFVVPETPSLEDIEIILALLNQGMNDNLAPIQKLVWV